MSALTEALALYKQRKAYEKALKKAAKEPLNYNFLRAIMKEVQLSPRVVVEVKRKNETIVFRTAVKPDSKEMTVSEAIER